MFKSWCQTTLNYYYEKLMVINNEITLSRVCYLNLAFVFTLRNIYFQNFVQLPQKELSKVFQNHLKIIYCTLQKLATRFSHGPTLNHCSGTESRDFKHCEPNADMRIKI